MPRLNDAKKITLGTTPVKALWLGDKKIWPTISEDLLRYLPTIDQLFFTTRSDFRPWGKMAFSRVNSHLNTDEVTFGITTKLPATLQRSSKYDGSTTNAFQLNALVNGDCRITATSGSRQCITVEVSGSNLRVATYGDRGDGNLSFSVYWPGGTKLLSISTMQDWYGYRIKVLIDGAQVETATNGGAFKRSENLFVGSEASISGSGNIIILTAAQRSLLDNSEEYSFLGSTVGEYSVSWTVYTKDQSIPDPVQQYFGVSPTMAKGWLFSGGVGGTDLNGAAGKGIVIPRVNAGDQLRVGSGGAVAASYVNPNYGQPSSLGELTTAGASIRPEPHSDAYSPRVPEFNLPGDGGKGATSDTPATPGKPGGLVIARTWG